MSELLKCPFCGSDATIEECIITRGVNHTGVAPKGAKIVDRRPSKGYAGPMIYDWERPGYTVHCTKSGCICRIGTKKFRTKEEAVELWNTRCKERK